jgi:hypothetical protein
VSRHRPVAPTARPAPPADHHCRPVVRWRLSAGVDASTTAAHNRSRSGKADLVPAHRRWPPGRPCRRRDGHLPHLRLPLVGPLPTARPGRPGRPAQHRPPPPPPSAGHGRGRDRAAKPPAQARPGPHRPTGRPAGLHGASRPGPPRPQPAGRHGPSHRSLGIRGSEAGARGSHLAAERHSVVLAQNHDTENYEIGAADGPELRHRRGAPSSLRGTCRHRDAVRPDDEAGRGDRRPVPPGRLPRRNLSGGWSLVFWIASLACLLASCWRPRSSSTSSTSSSSFLSLRLGVAIDGSDRPTDDAPNLTTGRRTHDDERE